MSTDIRKWMNLLESEGDWYSEAELMHKFITTANYEYWWETFIYTPTHEYLPTAQDAFQKFMKDEMKPAWISDVQIEASSSLSSRDFPGRGDDDIEYPSGKISWKVIQGEEDPDDY